jgi:probable rRNA maturation factor
VIVNLDDRSSGESALEDHANRQGPHKSPQDRLVALAYYVLEQEHAGAASELSLSFVDADEMEALNSTYRGVQAPTDVLSFACDAELLGDVVMCPQVAAERARGLAVDVFEEMELLVVHGILHLLGYDHANEADAVRMEAREDELLAQWDTIVKAYAPQGAANIKIDTTADTETTASEVCHEF